MTNQIPLQYITLGPLLGQTATAATIAQAQAVFPNIAIPFPNFTGTIGQMLKPFPQYNGISNPWANLGISTYNALQTTLVRRFAQGLTFTWPTPSASSWTTWSGRRGTPSTTRSKGLRAQSTTPMWAVSSLSTSCPSAPVTS
jgi:hypothetical protein